MKLTLNFGYGLDQTVIVSKEVLDYYQIVIQFIDFVAVWPNANPGEDGHLVGNLITVDEDEINKKENTKVYDYLLELGYTRAAEMFKKDVEDLINSIYEEEGD